MGHSVFLIFHNFKKDEISHYFTSREREKNMIYPTSYKYFYGLLSCEQHTTLHAKIGFFFTKLFLLKLFRYKSKSIRYICR